jgi:hypothetical protein
MRTRLFNVLLTLAGSLALTGAAHAAAITWGSATNISADSDVSTAGTLVGAFNVGGGGVASTTVNTVLFTGFAVSGNTSSSGNFTLSSASGLQSNNSVGGGGSAPYSNLSSPYQVLVSSLMGNTSSSANFTLAMSGLTTGDTYQFEWWSNDSNGFGANFTTASAGNSVTLNSATVAGTGGLGQFAVGTFVADISAAQQVTFTSGGGPTPQLLLNGFQLRDLGATVPEPSTALFGVAMLGVCAAARRRRLVTA